MSHRTIDNVTALGVDEIAWHRGHNYLTLVYQIDAGSRRLLWAGEQRTQATLESFFKEMAILKQDFSAQIKVICSDMWKPYLRVIAKQLPKAINILDRFHIMQKFGKALDKVRAEEAKRLRQEKQPPLLSKSRWCFLKRKENLTEKQSFKLNELLKMNLRTVRAYLLRELKFLSKAKWHFSTLVTFLKWNLFVYRDLQQWLDQPFTKPPEPESFQPEFAF